MTRMIRKKSREGGLNMNFHWESPKKFTLRRLDVGKGTIILLKGIRGEISDGKKETSRSSTPAAKRRN